MISERSFAASFSAFWAEILPLLTPSFVHIVNEGFKERLTDEHGTAIDPVPKNPNTYDPSVLAEFSFFLAKAAVEGKITVKKAFADRKLRKLAEGHAQEVVAKYEGRKEYRPVNMQEPELREGFSLALNYQRFFETRWMGQPIEFCPKIPGAGFLSSCEADISIGPSLFEVKTVDRNIAGKDIRQLVVYLALQAATGKRRWLRGGFFNPRRAVYHEFGVDDVVQRMAGRPAIEVFQDFVDFVCTRDIQIDMAF